MPLKNSASDAARSYNIMSEMRANKPRDQAIAIGYAVQRRARAKGRK